MDKTRVVGYLLCLHAHRLLVPNTRPIHPHDGRNWRREPFGRARLHRAFVAFLAAVRASRAASEVVVLVFGFVPTCWVVPCDEQGRSLPRLHIRARDSVSVYLRFFRYVWPHAAWIEDGCFRAQCMVQIAPF